MDERQGMLKLWPRFCGSFIGDYELIRQINDCQILRISAPGWADVKYNNKLSADTFGEISSLVTTQAPF